MRKKLAFMLVLLLITTFSFPAYAEFTTETTDDLASVVETIDGNAFIVKLVSTDKLAYVRLIGVDAVASKEALEFVTNFVQGKDVQIEVDKSINRATGAQRFIPVYMYVDGILLNSYLLEKGYAKVDASDKKASAYNNLINAEQIAKSDQIGYWNVGNNSSYYYTGNGINVNTADYSTMRNFFDKKYNTSFMGNLIAYRDKNPINTVEELKFVEGFTKEIYDQYRNQVTVSTNINNANENELKSLGLSSSTVDDIINYRKKYRFSSIWEFTSKTLVSTSTYDRLKDFLSLDNVKKITKTVPDIVVNINTATESQLTSISGVSSNDASKIVNYRDKGYGYKTIMELMYISGSSFSKTDLNYLEDNFKVMTDINTATDSEIKSLVGDNYTYLEEIKRARPFRDISKLKDIVGDSKYNYIKPYVYTDNYTSKYVNLSRATKQQLINVGVSSSDAESIVRNRITLINSSKDIPLNIASYNQNIALYTNVNTASTTELESLGSRLTTSLISDLVRYRQDQPFGNVEEVRQFFKDKNNLGVYDDIKNYIVVR